MPQDVLTLNALTEELHDVLVGGRIDRITQPEKDEVCMYVRAHGSTHCLVISANPNAPRMHLTTTKKDNPYAAPAFLMHLRRHIAGGSIEDMRVVNCDRIVRMDILGRNEMHDAVSMHLYVELMGRYSNIIAVDAEGVITDALRRIPPAENQLRAVLPHLKYSLPPRSKVDPDEVDAVQAVLAAFAGGDLVKYLFGQVAGMVNVSANQLVSSAGLTRQSGALSAEECRRLAEAVRRAFHVYGTEDYAPCYGTNDAGEYVDYYPFPYPGAGYSLTPTPTLNEAVRVCSEAKDKALRLKANGRHVATVIGNAIKKNEKLLAIAQQKLVDSADYETLRIEGELLTTNLYRLSRGQAQVTLYDYYHDCDVTIPLDDTLSPSENAQAYYKRYAKQKRTIAVAERQVVEYTANLQYLYSVQAAFDMAEDNADLREIEQELQDNGYIPRPSSKQKVRRPAPQDFCRYTVDGVEVLRGKNNVQNERLTFHTAKENDVWLHVKAEHGSHVVILSDGAPTERVLEVAAEIAAYYSNCRHGGKVDVDYAPRRQVKHHPARKTGMVLYTEYNTITVEPQAHKEYEHD